MEATLKDKACTSLFRKVGQEPKFLDGEKFTAKMLADEKWLAEIVGKLGLLKK